MCMFVWYICIYIYLYIFCIYIFGPQKTDFRKDTVWIQQWDRFSQQDFLVCLKYFFSRWQLAPIHTIPLPVLKWAPHNLLPPDYSFSPLTTRIWGLEATSTKSLKEVDQCKLSFIFTAQSNYKVLGSKGMLCPTESHWVWVPPQRMHHFAVSL